MYIPCDRGTELCTVARTTRQWIFTIFDNIWSYNEGSTATEVGKSTMSKIMLNQVYQQCALQGGQFLPAQLVGRFCPSANSLLWSWSTMKNTEPLRFKICVCFLSCTWQKPLGIIPKKKETKRKKIMAARTWVSLSPRPLELLRTRTRFSGLAQQSLHVVDMTVEISPLLKTASPGFEMGSPITMVTKTCVRPMRFIYHIHLGNRKWKTNTNEKKRTNDVTAKYTSTARSTYTSPLRSRRILFFACVILSSCTNWGHSETRVASSSLSTYVCVRSAEQYPFAIRATPGVFAFCIL